MKMLTLVSKSVKIQQKRKVQSNILDEQRCKIPQNNTHKLKMEIHKK